MELTKARSADRVVLCAEIVQTVSEVMDGVDGRNGQEFENLKKTPTQDEAYFGTLNATLSQILNAPRECSIV